jgi:formylglycine-generating enzyme required for sulfatase activity
VRFTFEITLDLSPAQKRVLRWGLVTGAAIGAIGLGVAFAALPTDLSWIKSGQPVKAVLLAQNLSDLQQQLIDPTCPPGYAQDTTQANIIDCKNGNDEVVKVGTKASAFWIDRYEASFWSDPAGAGTQYGMTSAGNFGVTTGKYPSTFALNGQRSGGFVPLYALSEAGVQPSAGFTWFQAVDACAASGKRLPRGDEWMLAASGTPDDASMCNTSCCSGVDATDLDPKCQSVWGARAMIGNLWEWTSEWFATLRTAGDQSGPPGNVWPDNDAGDYRDDGIWNVTSWAQNGSSTNGSELAPGVNVPVAGLRGGDFNSSGGSGVFAFFLGRSPTSLGPNVGVRCVVPSR